MYRLHNPMSAEAVLKRRYSVGNSAYRPAAVREAEVAAGLYRETAADSTDIAASAFDTAAVASDIAAVAAGTDSDLLSTVDPDYP